MTLKKYGSLRRIIYYKNLNNAVTCQTNITQSPYMCASACPPRKKKLISDAKDGYHSAPLRRGKVRRLRSTFVNSVVTGASVLGKDLSVVVMHTLID